MTTFPSKVSDLHVVKLEDLCKAAEILCFKGLTYYFAPAEMQRICSRKPACRLGQRTAAIFDSRPSLKQLARQRNFLRIAVFLGHSGTSIPRNRLHRCAEGTAIIKYVCLPGSYHTQFKIAKKTREGQDREEWGERRTCSIGACDVERGRDQRISKCRESERAKGHPHTFIEEIHCTAGPKSQPRPRSY